MAQAEIDRLRRRLDALDEVLDAMRKYLDIEFEVLTRRRSQLQAGRRQP